MVLNINIEELVSKFINNPEKEILLYWQFKEILLKRFRTSSNILQNNKAYLLIVKLKIRYQSESDV